MDSPKTLAARALGNLRAKSMTKQQRRELSQLAHAAKRAKKKMNKVVATTAGSE